MWFLLPTPSSSQLVWTTLVDLDLGSGAVGQYAIHEPLENELYLPAEAVRKIGRNGLPRSDQRPLEMFV